MTVIARPISILALAFVSGTLGALLYARVLAAPATVLRVQSIMLVDSQGSPRGLIGVDSRGNASIRLTNDGQTNSLTLGVDDKSATLNLFSAKGNNLTMLGSYDNSAGLILHNSQGRNGVSMSAEKNGKTHLWLHSGNTPHAAAEIAVNGARVATRPLF